ncbi:MAG TPA: SDR family NAD(P)-dependent oxidoreductase [Solirubrobacteraceae bacterium]|jgi:NAD(P)-dependent dehydrogenase (short-subunit alcohol dehydrogenase family)
MHEGGRIINMGSGVATRAGIPGVTDYTATKAALAGYTRGAARDQHAAKLTAYADLRDRAL